MKLITFILCMVVSSVLITDAFASPKDYYQTTWEIDALVGSEAIDFSSRPDTTMVVWNPTFNLSGYKRCIRSSTYSIDSKIAISLTCARVENNHVSMTITAMCDSQSINQDTEQMELTGDDMANHVLFTVKCRTKLIQQRHKS